MSELQLCDTTLGHLHLLRANPRPLRNAPEHVAHVRLGNDQSSVV